MDSSAGIGHDGPLAKRQTDDADRAFAMTLDSVLKGGFALGMVVTISGLLGLLFRFVLPRLKSDLNRQTYAEGSWYLYLKLSRLLSFSIPLTILCISWLELRGGW